MFSRKEQLIERTGAAGIGRFDYLKLLIAEYKTTKSKGIKKKKNVTCSSFVLKFVYYLYFDSSIVSQLFLNSQTTNTFVSSGQRASFSEFGKLCLRSNKLRLLQKTARHRCVSFCTVGRQSSPSGICNSRFMQHLSW